MPRTRTTTIKSLATLDQLKALADKHHVSKVNSRVKLAETISNLRGKYLTKREIEMIMPFIKNKTNKNTKILKKIHYPRAVKKASLRSKLAKKRRLAKRTTNSKKASRK
jgi:hypothetical protein